MKTLLLITITLFAWIRIHAQHLCGDKNLIVNTKIIKYLDDYISEYKLIENQSIRIVADRDTIYIFETPACAKFMDNLFAPQAIFIYKKSNPVFFYSTTSLFTRFDKDNVGKIRRYFAKKFKNNEFVDDSDCFSDPFVWKLKWSAGLVELVDKNSRTSMSILKYSKYYKP